MSLVFLISTRSADPNTKVGAVLLMDDKTVHLGFNGCPSGTNHEVLSGADKYSHVIHAESNCANRAGREKCLQQKNLTLYVPFHPCIQCAKQLVDFNVKRVVYFGEYKSSLNNDALLESIRRKGYPDGPPAFTLEKYNAEPLLFHHNHFGIK